MSIVQRITRRQLKIAVLTAGIGLVLFTLVGFFAIPPLLRSILSQKLTEALHREVTIQEIRLNPFALSVTVRGFRVAEREGTETFFAFEELYANAEISSIIRRGPVLREIRLTRPTVRLVRHAAERFNISDLFAVPAAAKPSQPDRPAEPLRFALNNIQLVEGSLDFLDEPVGRTHTVRQLTIGLPFLSSIPNDVDIFVEPKLEARINDAPYTIQGRTKPFADSLESTLEIDIRDVDLPHYTAYSPVPLKFKIPSGQLDLKAEVNFTRQKQGQKLTVQGEVAVTDFVLTDRREAPALKLPRVVVGIAPSEPLARKLRVAAVTVETPELSVRREKDGRTNLQALLPDPPPEPAKAEATAAEPAAPFAFLIDTIRLSGGKLLFTDAAAAAPFRTTLAPIDLTVTGLGNAPDSKAAVALTLVSEAKEQIRAEGTVGLAPLAAEIVATTRGILLPKYAPYYRDRIRFEIEDGKLETSARLLYAAGDPAPKILASEIGVAVQNLTLRHEEEQEEFARIPRLALKGGTVDLNARRIVLGSLVTEKGYLRTIRYADGETQLTRLLAPAPAAAAPPSASPPAAAPEPAWSISLVQAALEGYAVVLEDRHPSPATTHVLENVRLTAEKLSTDKNAAGKLTLALLADKAASLTLAATVVLDPVRAEGRLEIAGIPLTRYAPYYRDAIRFDIAEGVVGLGASFKVALPDRQPDLTLAGLGLTLEDLRLRLRDAQEEFLTVPVLAVRNGTVDLAKRQVVLGEIASRQAALKLVRLADGRLDVQQILPPAAAAAPAVSTPPAAPAADPAPAWQASIGALDLAECRIDLADRVPAEPVALTVDRIALRGSDLGTARNSQGKIDLSLRLNQGGTLRLAGSLGLFPLNAALETSLDALDIRPLQPYFTDRVKIVVSDGSVSAAGRLSLRDQSETGLAAAYQGEISLNRFASIDKAKAEDFLRWQSLALTEMDVGVNPFRFRARKVALTDFYARLVLHGDGTLNLQDVLARGEAAAAAPPPAAAPAAQAPGGAGDIAIDEVTLQGGRIDFSDRSVSPTFSTTMVEMGGRVSGLSSALNTLADLNLQGKLENAAPLEITGKINPLAQDLFVDLRVRFRDIELTPATPYTGKYIGYTIQKGKLSLDLSYLIERRKLDSKNIISLDQLTLGDPVESPHATKLPVRLAIALLKDRNGEIHLDIPVTGSLDDPQFSVWRIVFQVLGNLIVKAVASPFALLGAAFGGGERLSYLEFDYGTADIPAAEQKKLDALAKALRDRPSLKLDLTSFADLDRDRETLRQIRFQRKLQAQKALELSKQGQPTPPVETVEISPQEYERYLRLAYRAEPFPKPRNVLGLTKSLPVPEMEKLILTHIQVTDDDLAALAARRAAAVREALIGAQVPAGQIFILTPKSLTPEKKEKQRDSRVEFKIG